MASSAPVFAQAQAASQTAGAEAGGTPFVRGMDAYKHGDLDGAVKLLQQAVVAEPKNGDAEAVLGFILVQLGKYDQAIEPLDKATKLKTTLISPANSYMNLGKALLLRPTHNNDDTTRAVGLFEKAVELAPHSPDAQIALAFGYTHLARYSKAAAAYRQATVLAPKSAAAWKGLGVTLQKLGQNDEAADALQKSAALNSQDADTWAVLGDLEIQRGDEPTAESALETARKLDEKNVAVLVELGNLYSHQSRYTDAADAYGQAASRIEADPSLTGTADLATLRYDQGVALAAAGKDDDAATAYDKALAANPKNAEALLNSGTLYYKQDKLDEAITRFKAAAQLRPTSALIWKDLAAACVRNKDWTGAAEADRHVATLEPADYDARDMLVEALLEVNPLSDEAAKYYRQMASLRPKSPDALIGLGLLYQRQAEAATLASVKQAKLLAALQTFKLAIGRDPHSAIAYNDLGVIHERRAEMEDAITAYKKAIALDPNLADARQNLDRFRQADKATHPNPPTGGAKP